MSQKPSLFPMILAVLVLTGAVPLVVIAVQAGGVIPVVTGVVALAVVMAGGATWLARRVVQPVQDFAGIAASIKASVDAESADEVEPEIARLEGVKTSRELADLAVTFEQIVEAFRQRVTEFNSIYAMGQAISAKLDFEQTVQAVLDAVKQVVVFDAAEVSVLRGEKLIVEAWTGQEDFNNTTGREYRVGRGPTGMIALNKESVLVSTVVGDEEDLKRTLGYESAASEFLAKTHKVMINSFLGIPLLIGDRLIGTLTLVHRDPGRFTEADKRQLNKLAAQASIAIDNAIQIRQRESVLKAQIRELRVEIDEARINKEVEEITTTDYFQRLQTHAAKMRNRVYTRDARRGQSPEIQPDSDARDS